MRAVAQRVRRARVDVKGETVGVMQEGLLALVGVARDDGPTDAKQLAAKLANLRIFEDPEGRMNLSLLDTGGCLGVVSQFTLLGDARKGRRPAFSEAAPPEQAEPLIEAVVAEARNLGTPVITGRFQTRMEIELLNEGPVTILLDTRKRF